MTPAPFTLLKFTPKPRAPLVVKAEQVKSLWPEAAEIVERYIDDLLAILNNVGAR